MATGAPSSIVEPEQQQAGPGETLTESGYSSSNSAWQSSGSIGPFFAVISVLAILAVLSCYLGRRLKGGAPTPLESVTGRGCVGWVKRFCRQCTSKDVEVGGVGAKVMACSAERNECSDKDGEVAEQNLNQD